jgi:hypothetical protein
MYLPVEQCEEPIRKHGGDVVSHPRLPFLILVLTAMILDKCPIIAESIRFSILYILTARLTFMGLSKESLSRYSILDPFYLFTLTGSEPNHPSSHSFIYLCFGPPPSDVKLQRQPKVV